MTEELNSKSANLEKDQDNKQLTLGEALDASTKILSRLKSQRDRCDLIKMLAMREGLRGDLLRPFERGPQPMAQPAVFSGPTTSYAAAVSQGFTENRPAKRGSSVTVQPKAKPKQAPAVRVLQNELEVVKAELKASRVEAAIKEGRIKRGEQVPKDYQIAEPSVAVQALVARRNDLLSKISSLKGKQSNEGAEGSGSKGPGPTAKKSKKDKKSASKGGDEQMEVTQGENQAQASAGVNTPTEAHGAAKGQEQKALNLHIEAYGSVPFESGTAKFGRNSFRIGTTDYISSENGAVAYFPRKDRKEDAVPMEKALFAAAFPRSTGPPSWKFSSKTIPEWTKFIQGAGKQ